MGRNGKHLAMPGRVISVVLFPKSGELTYTIFVQAYYIGLKICC